MTLRVYVALASSLLCLSACSWVPDSLRPDNAVDVGPQPAGFVEGAPCQSRATVAPSPERPPGVSARQGGWVALEFNLFGRGKPSNVRVADASPQGVFDQAAIEAMSHATFAPLTERAVGCRYILVYAPK